MSAFQDIADRAWPSWVWDRVSSRIAFANPAMRHLWDIPDAADIDHISLSPETITNIDAIVSLDNSVARLALPFESCEREYKVRALGDSEDRYTILEPSRWGEEHSTMSLTDVPGTTTKSQWQEAFAALPGAVFMVDIDGYIAGSNSGARIFFPALVDGARFDSIFNGKEAELRNLIHRALANGESSLVTEDTSSKHIFHLRARPIRSASGQLSAGVLILIEPVARAKDTTPNQARMKWREAVQEVADIAFELDSQGRLIFYTIGLARELGCPLDALIGVDFNDAEIKPDDKISMALTGRTGWSAGFLRWRRRNSPGDLKLETVGFPIERSDSSHGGFGIVGRVVQDLPSQVQSETVKETPPDIDPPATAKLVRLDSHRTSQTKSGFGSDILRAFFETVGIALIGLRKDGAIVFANRQSQDLLAPDLKPLEGQALHRFFDPATSAALEAFFYGPQNDELSVKLSEGKEISLAREADQRASHLLRIRKLPDGGPIAYCASLQEGEFWKAREAKLTAAAKAAEHASQQKSEFISQLSHELRTPLNAILGFSDVMMNGRLGPIGNPQYHGYVADIYQSGQLVLKLVNDLLDLSKIESGTLELHQERLSLQPVVDSCLSLVSEHASRNSIELSTDISDDVPEVIADERSVQQILLNLLTNAIKFTPSGGEVKVTASLTRDNRIKISVSDTGIGMSPKQIDLALQPFHQITGATQHGDKGTGLGLPLAKALAEANHAGFEIESEPEQGTSINVTFTPAQIVAE